MACAPASESDLLIRGAQLLDGTGRPAVAADVRIRGGRIVEVDTGPGPRSATRVIDAGGLVVAPGFIDMHAHSDLRLLTEPEHLAKVAQGITLEVIGQDGLSYAPTDDVTLGHLRGQLAGWNGDPADFDWSWRTVGEYLDRLDQGIAVNAAYLVPQGTLRAMTVGWDDRPATPSELDAMRALLAQSLAAGAIGMSSGLTYAPGMYASTDELIELCRVVAAAGGYYSPHHRSYGAGALSAYAEMVTVARESGCPLHLAHATMNFPVNAGRAGELLALLDRALADGVDVTLDSYPYLAGATYLSALLPGWAAAGGSSATLKRLGDPATRAAIRTELERVGSDGSHGVPVDWATIEISGVRDDRHKGLVGQTVAQAAAEAGRPPADLFFDVLRDDELATSCLMHVGHEENVQMIMRHRTHTMGSDGLLVGDKPHPRAWGTAPRYLGRYVRELGVLDLPTAVHHLTGRAAHRLGRTDRGWIAPGLAADLVLFDPATIRDTATYDRPRSRPEGIPYVFVNGVAVIDDHHRTDALAGRAIRAGQRGH
jgi:N-acyl-D-amino-acid deacylase